MADLGIIEGEKLLIKIGDGGAPEVFAHPCLINTTRGISFGANLTETEVPDCDNPSAPAKIQRRARSVDFTITGAGKLHKTDALNYINWMNSGLPKNAQVVQNDTGANGGFTGSGALILRTFAITGEARDYQECTAEFVPASAATFVWAANA
jgi:hypothetical protein